MAGQVVSTTGAWVQRVAQDWLVLTLTGSAAAVGVTTALQFLPTVLFGLASGWIADRWPKRRVLQCTQATMAVLAGVLAGLAITHRVTAWEVQVIAFCVGMTTAVNNPARQSFVAEMVGRGQLRNAVSLNASVFQLGRLAGPAISGILLASVGSGYAFAFNAASFIAPLCALSLIREDELIRSPAVGTGGGSGTRLTDGVRYVTARPDMLCAIVLAGVFGMFTTSLPVTLAAAARSVLHAGSGGYAFLTCVIAVGSLGGALLSARRPGTTLRGLLRIGAALAVCEMLAAAPTARWSYGIILLPVGAAVVLFSTSANTLVQLAATDVVRGRVLSVYLLVFLGSGALGGPLVGAIDQHLGPRTGLFLAGVVSVAATVAVRIVRRAAPAAADTDRPPQRAPLGQVR